MQLTYLPIIYEKSFRYRILTASQEIITFNFQFLRVVKNQVIHLQIDLYLSFVLVFQQSQFECFMVLEFIYEVLYHSKGILVKSFEFILFRFVYPVLIYCYCNVWYIIMTSSTILHSSFSLGLGVLHLTYDLLFNDVYGRYYQLSQRNMWDCIWDFTWVIIGCSSDERFIKFLLLLTIYDLLGRSWVVVQFVV
ncbi:Hypothetical_protein [Hexamita inflata]|uniref:Hypothetical_protein n=1 Tax=Hexamita inflata TaxID=28002 RepID=A0AA86TMJ2_9EUKA|nr:Hypothetical protein HINF_LOCUS9480 [Hexamita inflata]